METGSHFSGRWCTSLLLTMNSLRRVISIDLDQEQMAGRRLGCNITETASGSVALRDSTALLPKLHGR